jgi:hypothetical protein
MTIYKLDIIPALRKSWQEDHKSRSAYVI